MTAKKSNKTSLYIYFIVALAGIVLACSSLISNEYLKLVIVMVTLGFGLFGIMKGLSNPSSDKENTIEE